MSVLRRMTLLALPFLAVSSFASASVDSDFNKAELTERFAKLGLQVDDVVPADINGLVEIQTNGGVLFASPDGQYFLAGTLYKLDQNGQYQDVLAQRQAPINAAKIEAMKDSTIEFKAKDEKYVVTVFTDITCGYCVKLHNEMQDYNDLGITVRYMAFPRQGPVGGVADQMASIWCADDQQAAMHDGKVNRKFPAKGENFAQCQDTIQKQYMLGRELGISGTPAIFLPSGEMVGGYLPAEQLLKRLEQK
ncbi:bifunctional protein-disulfide isomerase/oxidoreductase DsbC [Vibrio panuliri]|uniref:Thiol:disulfide interchange protein n=1 Tax=Vibrio panuliri TaxID=1381081 RepID=A0A1Q9HC99_9VIBR|nr:bifunctional protein-disulfide isomerase/oxidoreductase DsbC [Vibrio panuliri]KAB1455361.1 bifunctional protein-disulfide isomerase/oxidoreductase DsbC [Vibrio panuliri]OLQ85095.1 thiol:disulfide interchange protein [Vibrio panuliri]OLQ87018.1 thiol:disulfide interchange protein [Vibrio panuliri]